VAITEVPFRANVGRHDTQIISVHCKGVATDTVQEVGVRHRFSEQAANWKLPG